MEQKCMGLGDFCSIPNGTGGLKGRMPVLWSASMNTGQLTPNEFVAVTSANSAIFRNIYPKKGVIVPGVHADIVLWNLKVTKRVSARNWNS
jgi:dihydropyrimidinase